MEDKELLESNIIISKFMGWDVILLPIDKNFPTLQSVSGFHPSGRYGYKTTVHTDSLTWEKDLENAINKVWNLLCSTEYGSGEKYLSSWEELISVCENVLQKLKPTDPNYNELKEAVWSFDKKEVFKVLVKCIKEI